MKITRHFVTVGQRRVHYLRAGSGPAVAMLHACPVSSKVMRPLMQIFSRRFTCLAFDMPGFGQSDKLPIEQPSVEDFADALADTLTALGIEKTAAYGRHTGASIAVEFAARHPSRRSQMVMQYSPGAIPTKSLSAIWSRSLQSGMVRTCCVCGFATAISMPSGPGMPRMTRIARTPMYPMQSSSIAA